MAASICGDLGVLGRAIIAVLVDILSIGDTILARKFATCEKEYIIIYTCEWWAPKSSQRIASMVTGHLWIR